MNEKQFKKAGVIGCFILLVAIIVIQSIIDNAAIRRADNKVNELERALFTATERAAQCERELEDSRGTIRLCYNSVERLADDFTRQSDELSDIIGKLKLVREEVEGMEKSLYFFYVKYGLNNDALDNNGGELE